MAITYRTVINVAKRVKVKSRWQYLHFFRVELNEQPYTGMSQIEELSKRFPEPEFKVNAVGYETREIIRR